MLEYKVISSDENALTLAIGRFLLHFNYLDNLLSGVLQTALGRLQRQDLCTTTGEVDVRWKLMILDLLTLSKEGPILAKVSIDDIKQMQGLRNFLAHAHLEYHPVDGSCIFSNRRKKASYMPEQIDGMSQKVCIIIHSLRHLQAHYDFADVPIPDSN